MIYGFRMFKLVITIIGTGYFISYDLCSDSPARSSFNGIQRNDNKAGYQGQLAEIRMTMMTSGGPALGIDSAVAEARNVTTGSDWQYIGVLPINAQGIGWNNIYVLLGGKGVVFDNLNVAHSPTAVCDFIHLWGDEIGSDIIPDCSIDMRDLARLGSDWKKCNDPADPINCDLSGQGANGFFDDFSTYTLNNTGLSGTAPSGGTWQAFFGGSYAPLEGKGGWVQADHPGDAGEIIMIDGWGANPDPAKSGVYPHSGWVSPYFIGGDLYAHNTLFDLQGNIIVGDFGAATMYHMLTPAQQQKVKNLAGHKFDVELAMRYGDPSMDEVLKNMQTKNEILNKKKFVNSNLSKKYDLRVANVFHAGDGNLHPLILYDAGQPGELEKAEDFGNDILKICVDMGGSITGEHGVGIEKLDAMCHQYNTAELDVFHQIKAAFDPFSLLNPGKAVPTLHRCAELGNMHVHHGNLPHPELERF